MHIFDYSFLKEGVLPAELVNGQASIKRRIILLLK